PRDWGLARTASRRRRVRNATRVCDSDQTMHRATIRQGIVAQTSVLINNYSLLQPARLPYSWRMRAISAEIDVAAATPDGSAMDGVPVLARCTRVWLISSAMPGLSLHQLGQCRLADFIDDGEGEGADRSQFASAREQPAFAEIVAWSQPAQFEFAFLAVAG